MRRPEAKFVTPVSAQMAGRLGAAIRAARLARNATQQRIATQARMSALTWLKIERGEVAVAFGSWLSALEQVGLQGLLEIPATPDADHLGAALRREQLRKRARPASRGIKGYDL